MYSTCREAEYGALAKDVFATKGLDGIKMEVANSRAVRGRRENAIRQDCTNVYFAKLK